MARKTLEAWISEAILDPHKDAKISSLMLAHLVGGHQQVELHTYKFGGTHSVTEKELADMFRGKAETYAQDLDGRQMFLVQAFYGKKEAEARFPLVVTPQADPTHGGLMTEPPDATGQTMQAMRHKESAHTAIAGMIGQVYARQQAMDNHSLRVIEQQAGSISKLMEENFRNFGMVKELLFQLADNTHQQRMDEVRAAEAAKTKKQLLGMAPALLNSLTGTEVFPQATEDTALIEAVVENITEEQLQMMEMALPAAIMGPLKARFIKSMQKKREEESVRRALPTFKGNPEDDIEGGAP